MEDNMGASAEPTGLAGPEGRPGPLSRLGASHGIPSATRIIRGHRLTLAQQRFLLSLPPNGQWRETSSHDLNRDGPNALRGFGKSGLIDGYYWEPMQHRLTNEGIRVVAAIRGGVPPAASSGEAGPEDMR